jgi:CHAT domain-containing protein
VTICCLSALFIPGSTIVHAEKSNIISPNYTDSISYLVNISQKALNSADYDEALKYLNRLYYLRCRILKPNDLQIANSLINIATVYNMRKEPDSAIVMLNFAEKILLSNSKPQPIEIGKLYSLLGSLYARKGEFTIAENYLMQAENSFRKNTDKASIENLVRLYLRYMLLYTSSGQLEKARLVSAKTEKMIDEISQNSNILIYYNMRASEIETQAGNFENSINYQKKALNIYLRDSINSIPTIFSLYNNLGVDFLNLNKYSQSKYYFDLALKLKDRFNNKGKELANYYTNLGKYYDKLDRFDQSLKYYQLAVKALFPDFKESSLIINPKPDEITPSLEAVETFKTKAEALFKLYKKEHNIEALDASISTSLLVISLIEKLRNGYQTYESKLVIASNEDETFKKALSYINQAYYDTKDKKYISPAFEISEKNKSSLLLSSLRELEGKNFGEIPEKVLEKEKYLSKRIDYFKEQIYEEKQETITDSVKLNNWENYLFQAQKEHIKLINQFEIDYPNYYSLKYNDKTIDISKLQHKIASNTTIIEYSLTDSLLYTFVITKKNVHYHTQKIDSSFYRLVTDYLSEYQNFDFSRQFYSKFTEFCWQSKELYNILIQPVAQFLNDEKLVIVPDGIISYIPFETLIDSLPRSIPPGYFKDLSYILNRFDISYSFSSTIYLQTTEKKIHAKISNLLAFAPKYSSEEINLENYRQYTTRQKYRKNLYPIPGAKEEVEAIKKLINSDAYEGQTATETNFKNVAGNYDILHLAMHTVIDNTNPMYSKLIFTLINDSLNDGLLNTYEIFALKLKARMVVLSACSTGNGEFNKGEGVISLARGFVYAGTPSLVMTLWEVEDKSGAILMKDFYTNLLKGQSKSAALRNAKIKFLKEAKTENSHPFFWSSFVIMGNPDALTYSFMPIFLIAGVIILCLAMIIIYFKFK